MDFCEFLAEEELISIVPNFKLDKEINLISGDFGPFEPGKPIEVPLWMALNLHQQHKCTIQLPVWIKELLNLQEQQLTTDKILSMPTEYFKETLKLLQQHVTSIPNCCDLIERREAILKNSIAALFKFIKDDTNELIVSGITLTNLTKGEIYLIKAFVQKAFNHFQKLRATATSIKY